MKKAFIMLCLGVASHTLYAQSMSRQVVASAGHHATNSSGSLSSTVGEIVINTATSGTFLLTQGFQQPDANPTGINKTNGIEVSYSLFPNPASDAITLSLKASAGISVNIYIYDAAGRLIQQLEKAVMNESSYTHSFNIASCSAGNYYLKIVNQSASEVKTIPFTKH